MAEDDKTNRLRGGWTSKVNTGLSGTVLAGYAGIALLLGTFGVWSATAPIEGAVIAPGVVAAAGENIAIRHLEGGIIDQILVSEGDRVRGGEALLTLKPIVAQTVVSRLSQRLSALKAREVRLQAERDGKTQPDFPEGVVSDADRSEQQDEFEARYRRYLSETEILDKRRQSLENMFSGVLAQQTAAEEQLQVVREERDRKQALLDQGLTNRSEYTQLVRAEADLVGRVGAVEAEVASYRTRILEAEEMQQRLTSERVEKAVSELSTIREQVIDLEQQLAAARDVLDRTTIRAPGDGIIVRSAVNARGGVVTPGEQIFELLPTSEELIVNARLDPVDKDVVEVGQDARLRFSALNRVTTPEVAAKVRYISADRLVDDRNEQSFFIVRIAIEGDLPPEIDPQQISPGTPVEAFIRTGSRTFLDYVTKPLQDSLQRAFRQD